MMQHIVLQQLSISQILELKDPELLRIFSRYSPTMQKAIIATCRNLEDFNSSVTHPGYYQPVSIDVQCSLNDSPINIGKLQRGSILQVFQPGA